jgi:hypothetical protein
MLFMLAVPSGGSSIARTSQCETLTSAVFGTEEAWSWQRGEFVPYDGGSAAKSDELDLPGSMNTMKPLSGCDKWHWSVSGRVYPLLTVTH